MALRPMLGALLAFLAGCAATPIPAAPDGGRDAATIDASDVDAPSFDAGVTDGGSTDASADAHDGTARVEAGCGPAPELDAAIGDASAQCGACGAPGGPIGGGTGYPRTVARTDATIVVHDAAELLSALAAATCGDVVYVDDAVDIDLTGERAIVIPSGVTLASGRGVLGSLGGIVSTSLHGTAPLFAPDDRVRITGLRIRGPMEEVGDGNYDPDAGGIPLSQGIQAAGGAELEVDNCEIYGWSMAAVSFSASRGHVHHSAIHHNRRAGWGYGVHLVNASWVLVEANRFEWNRHSIAGNGNPAQGYEARFNVVDENVYRHAFDMHGLDPRDSGVPTSGDLILIHHNTFLTDTQRAVLIRGRPVTGAYIDHNALAHTDESYAVAQSIAGLGNFFVSDDCFPTTTPICP